MCKILGRPSYLSKVNGNDVYVVRVSLKDFTDSIKNSERKKERKKTIPKNTTIYHFGDLEQVSQTLVFPFY